MKKSFKKTILTTILVTGVSLFSFSSTPTQAAFSDNPDEVYYDLARIAYKVSGDISYDRSTLQGLMNQHHPDGKFLLISSMDPNNTTKHNASKKPLSQGGQLQVLENTGLQAYAMVIPSSKKLFIAFTGSRTVTDFNTARKILEGTTPGQLYQAQLFANYIYEEFEMYRDYKWYFTGHSLGGWLATKLYLDIRSQNWINNPSKYEYGGAFGRGKKKIDGVFTFNTLPIKKSWSLPQEQWDANKDGVYNPYIKNLYIKNEWLNSIANMHDGSIESTQLLAYFGTKGSIDKGIYHWTTSNYKRQFYPGDNVIDYYDSGSAPAKGHSISNFSNIVR